MTTPASIGKHPVHPMLVVIPMGLWVFSLVADLFSTAGGGGVWKIIALYTMGGGIAGALIAAVPGLIDFFSLKESHIRYLARYHMFVNLTATGIFAADFYLRVSNSQQGFLPLALSIFAIAVIGVGGWLGGELVYVQGVGAVPPAAQRRHAPELRAIPGGRARRVV
ncbi:MAG TPA: DUF2231 domain-containing protein [Candidatus Binatia bacterium]|jgi:uncharacterized membrane protein